MPKIFYVYEIEDRNVPYISEIKLPSPWVREVRRYKKGKQTRIEALFRTIGKRLSLDIIDDFIATQIHGTSKWEIYSQYHSIVENEMHVVEYFPKLLYTLKINTDSDVTASDLKLLPKICHNAN